MTNIEIMQLELKEASLEKELNHLEWAGETMPEQYTEAVVNDLTTLITKELNTVKNKLTEVVN